MGFWSDVWGGVKSAASSVANFVCESGVLKVIASAVVLAAGIAITVCTAGLAAGFGQMLIAGGASMLMTSLFKKNVSWADVGKSFMKGAIIGLVTMGFSSVATGLFSRFAAGWIVKGLLTIGSSTICSVLTNGVSNLMEGKNFFEGGIRAAILGVCIGGISAAASALGSYVTTIINKNIANENANMLIRGLSSIGELSAAYQSAVSSLGAGLQSAIGAASAFVMGLGETVLMQLMFDNGNINWKAALGCALVAGAIGGARAGMNARRRARDRELIEKALDDHEAGGELNKKDGQNGSTDNASDQPAQKDGPNDNVKKQPGCTAATRNEKNGKITYGESTGKRVARHGHDSQINTDDFPDNYKVKHKHKGIKGYTNQEAKDARDQNPPTKSGGQKVYQRACSEVDSHRNQLDLDPSAKPEHTTNVTIASGRDRNGNENVRFAPKCKEACAHNPDRSLSTPAELAANLAGAESIILDAQTATTQAYLITEHNKNDSRMKSSDMKSGSSGGGVLVSSGGAYRVSGHGGPGSGGCGPGSGGGGPGSRGGGPGSRSGGPSSGGGGPGLGRGAPGTGHGGNEGSQDGRFEDELPCSSGNDGRIRETARSGSTDHAPQLTTLSDEIRYERKLRKQLKKVQEDRQNSSRSSIIYKPEEKTVIDYARSGPNPSSVNVGRGGAPSPSNNDDNDEKREDEPILHSDNKEKKDKFMIKRAFKKGKETISKMIYPEAEAQEILPTPLVHQIIVYSQEHNEYRIRRPESWPSIQNKRSKLIAVAGMKQSGRTTLLHSLIYEYGCALTEDQAMASRIGVGVTMYVLEKPGVIILDIADSMDCGGEEFERSTPLGSALLELFGYINCDHVVYNVPILNDDADMTDSYLISWIENRIRILFESSQVAGVWGASKISIVLRPGSPGSGGLERVENVISSFINTITEDADLVTAKVMSYEGAGEQTPSPESRSQEQQGNKEITSKQLRTIMHSVAAFRLPYLDPDRLNAWDLYKVALRPIHERLEKDTAYHATADIKDEQEYNGPRSIVGTMISVWNALQLSDDIQKTFTTAATESGAAREKPDAASERLNKSMQSFLAEVQNMRGSFSIQSECKRLLDDLKELHDTLESQVEREKDWKADDRDQFMFIRYILSTACKIITAAREFSTVSNKELGLRVGLRGVNCLLGHGRGSHTVDAIALRFCLQDFAILPQLTDSDVYLNYSDCWRFLWHAAECGYKISLAAFPTVDAAKAILKRVDEELTEEKRRLHMYASSFVVTMLEEKVDLSALTQRQVDTKSDGKAITHERMRKLTMSLRVGLKKKTKTIIQSIRQKSSSDGTEQLLDQPRDWFDKWMVSDFKFTYDEMDSKHKNGCMQVAFEVASEEIAFITASELVDAVEDWLTFDELTSSKLASEQLRVLAECVSHAARDDELFLKLCKNTTDKLIAMRKIIADDEVNKHIEHVLLNMMSAEHRRKKATGIGNDGEKPEEQLNRIVKRTESKEDIQKKIEMKDKLVEKSNRRDMIHDMEELKRTDMRKRRLARNGFIRLHCMEDGLGDIAVKRLLAHEERPVQFKHQSTLLNFVDAFVIVEEEDEHRKMFVEPIMKERGNILRIACKLICDASEKLSETFEDTESNVATAMHIVAAGCSLYNELLQKFQWHDMDDFYDAAKIEKQSKVHRVHNDASDTANAPSFVLIRDALSAVHHHLLARRSALRNADRGKHSDTVNQTVVKAVISLLNASTTCGISLATVKAAMQRDDAGSAFVATLTDISEPAKPRIIVHHKDLAKLTPKEDVFHQMNILRAAYLVYLADTEKCNPAASASLSLARTETLSAVEEAIIGCGNVVKQEENMKQEMKRIELEESQRKESGQTIDGGVEGTSVQSPPERRSLASMQSNMPSTEIALAIDGVYLQVYPYRFRKSHGINYVDCEDFFGVGGAFALRMLVRNQQSRELIAKLRNHFEKCMIERGHSIRMKMSNETVSKIMQLAGAREALEATGHREVIENDEIVWIFNGNDVEKEHRQALETFMDCHDEWIRQSAIVLLYSEFAPCSGTTNIGRDALLRQCLPSEFFTDNNDAHAATSIRSLLELRTRDKSSVKTQYVLVRIQLRANRLVQAIFPNVSSVESVLAELCENDPLVKSVEWISTSNMQAKDTDNIGQIGTFAIYGVAQY